MKRSSNFDFNDLQGLLRFGYGKLSDTCFMLLNILDVNAAKQWLDTVQVSNAVVTDTPPSTALQIAFSVQGLIKLGVSKSTIDGFSDEFIYGMTRNENCSRRLGDIGRNAPEYWQWGSDPTKAPHILLMLYAKKGDLEAWRKTVEDERFSQAFQLLIQLPTSDIGGGVEPFGFRDDISQPTIDRAGKRNTDLHENDHYTNLLAVGETVLGYRNEYGQYTVRPLIDPKQDKFAKILPDAEDNPTLKDFGRNGTYLVLRQLDQNVHGFWQFLDKKSNSVSKEIDQLAASMVGREKNGIPLIIEHIPGVSRKDHGNHFTFDLDQKGRYCPIGAHIRRANPRTGDLPPRAYSFIGRLTKILGFGRKPEEDLVASSRFHRLLRRGRSYGPLLSSENAIRANTPTVEHGLHFICLVANIGRQFEFVQNTWIMNSKFDGLQQERDPLLGNREPLINGETTDHFSCPNQSRPAKKIHHLPQFVTVLGGGYFFMPSLRVLKYISAIPVNGSESSL